MLKIFILGLFALSGASGKVLPTEKYSHHAALKTDDMKLYWKFNDTHITFEVHGRTTGWIGIGFSPNGAMTGADIYVGWVKDGKVKVTDRHGVANSYPPLDPNQDIQVLDGSECEGWTMFKFSRQLAACEDDYDREISQHTQRLIWAWGNSDPTGDDIQPWDYHAQRRGGQSMYFLQSSETPLGLPQGPEYKTFDILMKDFHVPEDQTYYNCMLMKLPSVGKKHHIVKYEPIIQEGNEANVHHILIYRCGDVLKDEKELGKVSRCFSPNMQHFATCSDVIAEWAVGAGATTYPEVAGMSIGAEGDPVYIQLEVHYDNPFYRPDIVDSSGIRFTYTDTLRQHDIGVLGTGVGTIGMENFIPPGIESFTTVGHCRPFCLNERFDNAGYENITVFSVMLHAHLTGKKLRLRHIRDGVELPFLGDDQHYDFNYQEARYLHPHVVIRKNDSFRAECVYNTKDRKNVTEFGLGTREEMCFTFVFYYPKLDLSHCISSIPYQAIWGYFGISSQNYSRDFNLGPVEGFPLKDVDVTDQISPNSTTPITLHDYLNSIEWTPEKIKQYENFRNSVTNYGICIPNDRSKSTFEIFNVSDVEVAYTEPKKQCRKERPASPTTTAAACFEATTSNPRIVSTKSHYYDEQPTTIQVLENFETSTSSHEMILPAGIAAAIVGSILLALAAVLAKRR